MLRVSVSKQSSLAMNWNIFVPHYCHLASLVWAKLILGRFRDAVLPGFSRFRAGSWFRVLSERVFFFLAKTRS